MRNKRIRKVFSCFILIIFCLTGIYQSFDLADSFFVCQNENNAAIYETSFIDFTQDIFIEDSSSLTQFIFNRREHETDFFNIDNTLSCLNSISSDKTVEFSDICFGSIIQENCLNHFCRSVITNYIHLKDGQKIA